MEISKIIDLKEKVFSTINRDNVWEVLPHTKQREKWLNSTFDEKVIFFKELHWHYFKKRLINGYDLGETEIKLYSLIRDQYIARYLQEYKTELDPRKGIILSGSVGVGKTTFLESIAEAEFYLEKVILNPHIRDTESSLNNALKGRCSIIINEEMREFAKQKTPEISNDLIYNSMLFDEFGDSKEESIKIMGNSFDFISDILYKRHSIYIKQLQKGMRPIKTMLTTNLTKNQIIERYNQKAVDRLFEMCEIIEWDGMSKRR